MDYVSEKLSSLDLKEVLQVSRVALECEDTTELAKEVLRLMEKIFRTNCSNFFFSLPWSDELDVNRVISQTISEASFDKFRKYYHKLDPFIHFYSLKFCPTAVSTEQILPYKELTSSEYYNEFLKPQSIHSQMSIFLKNKNGLLGNFNLFRPPDGPYFTRRDRAKAELMAPYLTQALNRSLISEKSADQTAVIDKILSDLPFGTVVLMNEWLEPIYCSETAKEKLPGLCRIKEKSTECLRSCSKILSAHFGKKVLTTDSGKTPQLKEKRIKLPAKKGNAEIIVRQVRMGSPRRTFFAVCLENEEGGVRTTQEKEKLRSMGLTQREMEVVLLLSEGLKNPEIGKKLFISGYTVENHLRSIFRKMGVTNRTAATNRVLRIPRRVPTLFWLGEVS